MYIYSKLSWEQGDQIGRIFAYWASVHFRQFFFKIIEAAESLG
jgi:hypothetical protein